MKAVVIGAGLGGLAAGIRLASSGSQVTILEKNERVGGKMNIWQDRGYRFDTGPTLLTMPSVLDDLFTAAGRKREDYITFTAVEPLCRYFYPDGVVINASSDLSKMKEEIARLSPEDAERFPCFLQHGKDIFTASSEPFLFSSFGSLDTRGALAALKYLPSVAKIDAFRTLDECVRSYFGDLHLQQLFNRFATYNGSSPYLAPATLAIIPYIEFTMGGWYINGGMYKLADALRQVAQELGVDIRTGKEVVRIDVSQGRAEGVTLATGDKVKSDVVVCNADALYALRDLIPSTKHRVRYEKAEPSLAGVVMCLGVKGTFPQLAHHNIFFSADYRAEFDTLVRRQLPADDPTVYVSVSSQSDGESAPPDCTNLFVLVNAPALSDRFDWRTGGRDYRERVLAILARRGLADLEQRIETELMITPSDFESRYHAYRGSIYGTSSNSRMAAFLRPANVSKDIKRLYFVGGGSHPGGGIPLVLLSGKIVASLIERSFQRP